MKFFSQSVDYAYMNTTNPGIGKEDLLDDMEQWRPTGSKNLAGATGLEPATFPVLTGTL
jgi:hypothetical protein